MKNFFLRGGIKVSEEDKNDAITGASETIDASSGSSMLEHEEPEKEETTGPWPGPKGMIPVTSGKADDANVHNRVFLDNILVEMRVID